MKQYSVVSCLECYVKKDGKYLMLQRHATKRILPNIWMAPGGKREHNEGLFECTRREIKEETGLEIKNLKIRATGCAYLEDLDEEVHFHFIFADWKSGRVKPESEVGKLVWLTPKQILELPDLLTELKDVLPLIFNSKDENSIISFKSRYSIGNTMTEIKIEDPT